jgi:hypothetical protein
MGATRTRLALLRLPRCTASPVLLVFAASPRPPLVCCPTCARRPAPAGQQVGEVTPLQVQPQEEIADGEALFQWLVSPVDVETFEEAIEEQQPLLVSRPSNRHYFGGLLSKAGTRWRGQSFAMAAAGHPLCRVLLLGVCLRLAGLARQVPGGLTRLCSRYKHTIC